MRKITGTVQSNRQLKTLIVKVDRERTHAKYKKKEKISKKFYVDVSNSAEYNVGDTVTITEGRPTSKLKRWSILNK